MKPYQSGPWHRAIDNLLLLAVIASSRAAAQPQVDWMRKNAIPLKTVEAGNGFDDMQPLKKVIGDARIVSLGEATHGTREFFQLKHRMIEFLASQMGFTIFSIEANMPEAYRLNDYVLNGTGDPRQLLKGTYFWTWDTDEVLNMILWMREFNRSGKGMIEFTGFDMQTPTVAMDIVRTFVSAQDPSYYTTLEPIYQDVTRVVQPNQSRIGVTNASLPLQAPAGKHVKYTGYIKTEGITQGYAALWWRVDGEKGSKPLAFDNMQDRGATGTTPWTRYEISLDVPANATNIYFGVLHRGDGTAWFDSLQVEIDGVPYTGTDQFDFDFESESLRGFHPGGDGYDIGLDKDRSHTGKQSLRIRPREEQTSSNQNNNEKQSAYLLSQSCKQVVDRLESNRANFVRAGSSADRIDWAIQNARVVLQSVQMKSGEKTRDESMAENVKWIADHNPNAKLVLWAHNGHVAYTDYPGTHSMGSYLHKMFGGKLVTFGLAFNEGSFQAVETNKKLRAFTVGPAPADSLDRTLAATGIPLFALDLRNLPKNKDKDGPVAQWFSGNHASRSIGSGYSDALAPSLWSTAPANESYDAILFVEKTTAAHPNP
jgi:erythromycin esterase-like protein